MKTPTTYADFHKLLDEIDAELNRLDHNDARQHSRANYLRDERARIVREWQTPAES